MKLCTECKRLIEDKDVFEHGGNSDNVFGMVLRPAGSYHRRWAGIGGGHGLIGFHMVSTICGPLRDLTPEVASAEDEIQRLEVCLEQRLR